MRAAASAVIATTIAPKAVIAPIRMFPPGSLTAASLI
jgi:hypothetical protein